MSSDCVNKEIAMVTAFLHVIWGEERKRRATSPQRDLLAPEERGI